MAGEVEFADALRQRVRLLAGLTEADLQAVRDGILLAPGARTLVRTLKRLGYELAVVSGGFTQVLSPLAEELGIDHLAANVLVLEGGVLTGELDGAIVDRAGKAKALVRFAEAAGVPLARTIAVGDGANDIDMLAMAGPASRSTRSRSCARRPTRRSAFPISTPSSSSSASRVRRSNWPTASNRRWRRDRAGPGRAGEAGTQPRRPTTAAGLVARGRLAAWLIGGPFLIAAGPDAWAKAALSVYVGGMLVMFGTSAAFHRLRWSAPAWRRMRRADHSAIFVGIAGTSTAVAGLALRGWAEVLVLAMVRAGAAVGVGLRQVWLDAPQWVVAIPYVVVGWCPVIVAPQLVRSLGWAGFGLMLAGGAPHGGAASPSASGRDPWLDALCFH